MIHPFWKSTEQPISPNTHILLYVPKSLFPFEIRTNTTTTIATHWCKIPPLPTSNHAIIEERRFCEENHIEHWKSLAEDPPLVSEYHIDWGGIVVLYRIHDHHLLPSNRRYAFYTGQNHGYTHWWQIPHVI